MISEVETASVRLLDRQSVRPGAQRETIMVSLSDVVQGEDVGMSYDSYSNGQVDCGKEMAYLASRASGCSQRTVAADELPDGAARLARGSDDRRWCPLAHSRGKSHPLLSILSILQFQLALRFLPPSLFNMRRQDRQSLE